VPDPLAPVRFYVTFDRFFGNWSGHLTVGMHSYYWSSTDEDDARLLTSGTFETLDEAIVDLKKQIARLSSVLLGVDVGF
jgi:hypothetical protein